VLDCLAGYLSLAQRLFSGEHDLASAWNFGSPREDNRTVAGMLTMLREDWPDLQWHTPDKSNPHETGLLFLDSSKARSLLKWMPVWNLRRALGATAEWYRGFAATQAVLTEQQLSAYLEDAVKAGCSWACP
jgi:CDP-glucose 4,6-dehydratase